MTREEPYRHFAEIGGPRDERGNWRAAYMDEFYDGRLFRPWYDEESVNGKSAPIVWPAGHRWAVCLTHDVDDVSLGSVEQLRRWFAEQRGEGFWRRYSPKHLLVKYRLLKEAEGKWDPLWHFEDWLALEREVGARSTFFFQASRVRKRHKVDGRYRLGDVVGFNGRRMTVAEMMREIDRAGWEIGLHASFASWDSGEMIREQREEIEEVIGRGVISNRQHYLHFDVQTTPSALEQGGIRYDSSLGFNRMIGFRGGTAFPYYLFDYQGERETRVLEIPLIIQDAALLGPESGMGFFQIEPAVERCVEVMERVESVGGCLTLVWHPEFINDPLFFESYRLLLQEMKKRNPWFCFVGELGRYWEESGNMRYEEWKNEVTRSARKGNRK